MEKEREKHKKTTPSTEVMINTRFDLNDSITFDHMHQETIKMFNEEEEDYEETEVEFNGDVIFFKGVKYEWSDKYKPRKPKFFNRVKSGFEWNPYNKKHYDLDNPPPKIVQGYKFNMFYPDLINKQETPQYYLENCEDPAKVRIIFKAGPPYEDIAFEIVNKEWEMSEKNGFKCVFDRGILHL